MTTDEIIAVVTAYKEGKVIECREKGMSDDTWDTIGTKHNFIPRWNFEKLDYRAKPELREFWELVYAVVDGYRCYGNYSSREDARDARLKSVLSLEIVHFREVPKDEE